MPKSTISVSPIAGETLLSIGSESEADDESSSESCCAISPSISNIYDVGEEGADKIISRDTGKYSKVLKSIDEES